MEELIPQSYRNAFPVCVWVPFVAEWDCGPDIDKPLQAAAFLPLKL